MSTQLLCIAFLVNQGNADPSAFINRELAQHWQAQKLTPAERVGDLAFLRRASLDLIGRIPTVAEQDAFRKDPEATRRRKLVDRLLAHEDYARHWANVWTDWLLGAAGEPDARQAFHGWLQQHFARNRSHQELAEKLITASGPARANPAVHYFMIHRGKAIPEKAWADLGQYDMIPATNQVFRILHARRLQCIQCHDHPFDGEEGQSHFHAMNAFFRQVRVERDGIRDDPKLNAPGFLPFERRNGPIQFGGPRYAGDAWKPGMKQTRRQFFAERFVKQPDFARGHVNFMWAYLFGHPLTKSHEYDDMGPHNPVVQEKIMDRLAAEFVKSGHDSKALLRWICNSSAYSLASTANPTNVASDKAVYLSRVQARPLSRHQLAESLVVALTTDDYLKRRAGLRAELLKEFKPVIASVVQECEVEPLLFEWDVPLHRALWMMNSKTLQREIADPNGTVAKSIDKHGATLKSVPELADDLYRLALCRPPSPAELRYITSPTIFRYRPGSKTRDTTPEFWSRYGEDILWALLNSNEFGLNH